MRLGTNHASAFLLLLLSEVGFCFHNPAAYRSFQWCSCFWALHCRCFTRIPHLRPNTRHGACCCIKALQLPLGSLPGTELSPAGAKYSAGSGYCSCLQALLLFQDTATASGYSFCSSPAACSACCSCCQAASSPSCTGRAHMPAVCCWLAGSASASGQIRCETSSSINWRHSKHCPLFPAAPHHPIHGSCSAANSRHMESFPMHSSRQD